MAPKHAPRAAVSRLNLPMFLLALFGVLVVVHLWVQSRVGFAFGCTGLGDGAGSGCAAVTGSPYSSLLGLDLLVWGGLFYLVVAALRLGVAGARVPLAEKLKKASLGATAMGFAFSLYLVSVQAFVLNEFCALCLASSATTTALFGLHVVEWRRGPAAGVSGPAHAGAFSVMGLRPYVLGIIAFVVLSGAIVMLLGGRTPEANLAALAGDGAVQPTSEELAQACQYDPELQRFALFDLFTSGRAVFDGSPTAQARALKIFDPNCPHCATLHAQMTHIVPAYRDRIRFYYQPIALWDWSIPQIQAMYLAREKSHEAFLQMMNMQFEGWRPGGIPADTLVAWAGQIGLDEEAFRRDLLGGKYVPVIQSERQMSAGAGVNSVPMLFFEGRAILNTRLTWSPECLRYFAREAVRHS